jgi:hypothetical protein
MKEFKKIVKLFKHILTLTILLSAIIQSAFAQNIESIGQKDQFKVNSGLSINQMAYTSSDSLSLRDPYSMYMNGNLTFSLYGWSVPFSFSYSNQKTSYTQPFNQYSLHPYYKWIKLHLGYTSMSFTPYSLNGHLFLGGGVELTPKSPFTFSAMYGRLRKTIKTDTITSMPSEYERWGYGFKAGYNFSSLEYLKAGISMNMFHAKDNKSSLSYIPDTSLTPGENIVLGTTIDATIASCVKVSSEFATSAVTTNTNSAFTDTASAKWYNNLSGLFKSNATTQAYNARKINISYFNNTFTIGMGYERVEPGYSSYGAYYFNNDFENITVNGSVNMFANKVNVSANVGKQRDNLDNTKTSAMKRWVTAMNIGYVPTEKLNLSLSYSTFNSYMHIKPQVVKLIEITPYENLDTLNYTQLSSSTSMSLSYILKNTEQNRQNVNFNASYQQSSEQQGDSLAIPGSKFYNFNTAYSYSIVPMGLTAMLSVNTSFNIMPDMSTKTVGPTMALSKLMFNKKLRNSLSVSYNRVFTTNAPKNGILGIRLNSSCKVWKRHNLNLGLTLMNRESAISGVSRKINEFIATFGYSVNF